jgi:hypothetical protein
MRGDELLKMRLLDSHLLDTFGSKSMFGTNSICYQRPKAGYKT